MECTDFQFGNLGPEFDFNPDITGSTYQRPVFEDSTDTDLPNNFWFQNSSGISLIMNNELRGRVDNKFGDTVRLNENQQVVNKVCRMAMADADVFELERTLKLSFSHEDFRKNPFLQAILFILPMVGKIFWMCWPFRSEDEAKQMLRRKNGVKPVFASQCSKCNSCQYNNSISPQTAYCSKLGLPIFENDFKISPPYKVISHLRIAELMMDTKKKFNWDDVRKAVIFPPEKAVTRFYNYFSPPKKEYLPGAQYRKKLLALNRLGNEKQARQEEHDKTQFILSVVNPLIIKVQESFLKNRQNDRVVNDFIQKVFIPLKYKEDCLQIIESLKRDILLWAGIRFYLPSYLKCNEAEQFINRNHLKISYAIERQDCKNCIDNKNGYCKRLECQLIGYKEEIPVSERKQKIEFVGNNFKISQQIIDYCKSLEQSQPLSGLRKLREVLNSGSTVSVYSGAGLQDLNALSKKGVSEKSATEWINSKLKGNGSILRIEKSVREVYGSKKGSEFLQNEILKLKIRPTDANEMCLTEYQIDTSQALKKLNRCTTCSSATSLYCKKYNQRFALSFNEVPPEVKEIMSVFNDSPIEVEIDPIKKTESVNIFMDNPGDNISIDVHVEKPLDDQKLWQEAKRQQLEIETPEPTEFDKPLDIDMGETGDGMILDDSLL